MFGFIGIFVFLCSALVSGAEVAFFFVATRH
jgi:hypothetical protein